MHRIVLVILGTILSILPTSLKAESGSSLPPPIFDVPFDDLDPVVAQTELTQDITVFLHKLNNLWGSSPETLRGTITGDVERDERDALVVARQFADHGILEGYDFREGSLIAGQYLVLQRPVNGLNEFIDYYGALKTSLTDTYGRPTEDQSVWKNDLYQPLPDYWGIAVQMGHLSYAARWDTPDGMISIELTGNHHSRLAINYRSHASLASVRNT